MKIIIIILVLIILLSIANAIYDMKKLTLFSPVEGIITLNGKPIAGAEVRQNVLWSQASIPMRTVKTDSNGKFTFSELNGKSMLARILPLQPSMVQTIDIVHDNNTYKAYNHHKTNYDLNSENTGLPLLLDCELTEEEARNGSMRGVCKFRITK